MYTNLIYHSVSEALPNLAHRLLADGVLRDSRAGRVRELTHVGITLRSSLERELLVEGRRASLPASWKASGSGPSTVPRVRLEMKPARRRMVRMRSRIRKRSQTDL